MVMSQNAAALLLGVVEGVAEWLPISSTGHLILAESLLHLQASPAFWNLFLVVVQLGAVLAFALVRIRELWPDSRRKWTLWLKILLASVPAGAAGLLFDDWIEGRLRGPWVFIAALFVYGALYVAVERAGRRRGMALGAAAFEEEPTYLQALGMGCFQALALIPGTSRSGSTILGGLVLAVPRKAAVRFGFLMAIPVTFGAGLLKIAKAGLPFGEGELALLLFGAGAAFLVSLLASRKIVGWLETHSMEGFGWYRMGLSLLLLVVRLLNG